MIPLKKITRFSIEYMSHIPQCQRQYNVNYLFKNLVIAIMVKTFASYGRIMDNAR